MGIVEYCVQTASWRYQLKRNIREQLKRGEWMAVEMYQLVGSTY